MPKKISLKDIAQKVGVSTALVSYVLNNLKKDRISKDVAQKIREVAQELNYHPNQIAKSLKTSKTGTIGLVVADIANPFSSGLARIVEDEAHKHNYTVIFGSSDENAEKAGNLIHTLLNRQVDGLLIASPEQTEAQIAELQQQGVPFVLIDRYFPSLKTNYIALDNYGSVRRAVQHLIQSGYQRVGMITFDTTLFHIQERRRGYQDALSEAKIQPDRSWLKELARETIKTEIGQAIDDLLTLPEPVDAILFASNSLALSGLKHIQARDLRVPDDIALVSFDETEAYDFFYAPLTYIRQPLAEMGQLATQTLLESIGKNDTITQANLAGELVVRASTQPLADFQNEPT